MSLVHREVALKQLEELYLLKSALLPGETLTFVAFSEDDELWEHQLNNYPDIIPIRTPHKPPCVRIAADDVRLFLEVDFPAEYPCSGVPSILVKGDDITRREQERWQNIVREHMGEVHGSECVQILFLHWPSIDATTRYTVYDLVSTHLLPLLHIEAQKLDQSEPDHVASTKTVETRYHALLTSHHLISPTKRRNLQQWSSQLNITGFAKVGYPGVIYCEGLQDQIEEFVANIKAMQWLALRVRFIERVSGDNHTQDFRRWVELEKVGEVVGEMRRLGRESFVVEMGIGSAGRE